MPFWRSKRGLRLSAPHLEIEGDIAGIFTLLGRVGKFLLRRCT